MIVPDDDAAALVGIGVVVPITRGGDCRRVSSPRDQLIALTAPDRLAHEPARTPSRAPSAILAVDPAIPAAIRVLGTSAPAVRGGVARTARGAPAVAIRHCSSATRMSRSSSRPGCRARSHRRRCRSYMSPADFVPATEPTPEPTPGPTPRGGRSRRAGLPRPPHAARHRRCARRRVLARRGTGRPRDRRHTRRPHASTTRPR